MEIQQFQSWALLIIGLWCVWTLFFNRFKSLETISENFNSQSWPMVSIVIPARNEAEHIQAALSSVINLDYPNYEILVVNDRSTDSTLTKIQELQTNHPQLKVLTITDLPKGWLGKNHALQQGLLKAAGKWIVFTDADIVFSPSSLKKAITHAESNNLDHLPCMPRLYSRNIWLSAVLTLFTQNILFFYRPWKVKNKNSPHFFGIGAFNLFRRQALIDANGLTRLRLRPDEDMKLGKLMKINGYRCDVGSLVNDLQVEWYTDFKGFIQGTEKNIFAGMEYSIFIFVFGILSLTWAVYGPWYLLVTSQDSLVTAINIVSIFAQGLCFYIQASHLKFSKSLLWCFPAAAAIVILVMVRSVILTLLRGGIYWRDTFYSLEELKSCRF